MKTVVVLLAVAAALVLVPARSAPAAPAALGLQPVTIACSVDSPFTLGADPATVSQLALALAAMTDPTCAIAQTDPTVAPDPSYAVGGGLNDQGTKFSFSAHQNTPDPPSGYAHISGMTAVFGAVDVQGHVTCLSLFGNAAQVEFEFEKGSIASNNHAVFNVVDNGPPGG